MRSWLFSLVLAVALGMLVAAPTTAGAQQLPPVMVNGYRLGGYGYFNAVATPVYRWQVSPWGFNQTLLYPGAYSTTFTPFGMQRTWVGQSFITRSFNPWTGWSSQVTTPMQSGFTFNPYIGFQPYVVPGATFTSGYNPIWGQQWWLSPNYSASPLLSNPTLAASAALELRATLAASAITNSFGTSGFTPASLGLALARAQATQVNLGTRTTNVAAQAAAYNGYVPPSFIMR